MVFKLYNNKKKYIKYKIKELLHENQIQKSKLTI